MEKTTIEMAILGLEEQKKKIEQAILELRTQLSGAVSRGRTQSLAEGSETVVSSFKRKRRRMSAEAKRKISEGMKRRYAELRKLGKKKAA